LLQLCREKDTDGACDYLQKHIKGAKEDIKALLLRLEEEA